MRNVFYLRQYPTCKGDPAHHPPSSAGTHTSFRGIFQWALCVWAAPAALRHRLANFAWLIYLHVLCECLHNFVWWYMKILWFNPIIWKFASLLTLALPSPATGRNMFSIFWLQTHVCSFTRSHQRIRSKVYYISGKSKQFSSNIILCGFTLSTLKCVALLRHQCEQYCSHKAMDLHA